jgi:hypothetical protein
LAGDVCHSHLHAGGWTFCYPKQVDEFPIDLVLTQSGTMVSGTLASFSGTSPTRIPVMATVRAEGMTSTLGGSLNLPQGGAVEVLRITAPVIDP